jgi:CheY-like chemotaxis protein
MRGLAGARVLLVEDNELNQELAAELLRDAGVAVTLADHGAQALALLQASPSGFDAVLMDCQMPEMDGYEATRRLRADPRWRTLPVIAVTANAMAGDSERILAAGMDAHLAKPLDIDLLYATLSRWLAVSRGGTSATNGDSGHGTGQEMDHETGHLAGHDTGHHTGDGMGDDRGLSLEDSRLMRTGLAAAGDRMPLYRRLIDLFSRTRSDVDAQLQAAHGTGDTRSTAQLAHVLRGAAGAIGAASVVESATRLERACDDGMPAGERAALVTHLRTEVVALLAALPRIAAALDAREGPTAPQPRDEPAVVAGQRLQLRRLMEMDDASASTLAERMLAALTRQPRLDDDERELMAALEAARRFDFPEALARMPRETTEAAAADPGPAP